MRPAGHRSHLACACGDPTRWLTRGDGAAASCRRRGAPREAALSGRMRRRVGGLGWMSSPSDRSRPAGQDKSLHAVKEEEVGPRGKKEARQWGARRG
jgi:hypothetical protein